MTESITLNEKKVNKLAAVSLGKVLGGALLVTGTCVGAGMLSLPVATAAGGFAPSLGLFGIVWAIMTFTAFTMAEVTLWFEGDINLITMANNTLGNWGANIAWITYIFFLYSLMAAYTSSGSAILTQGLNAFFPLALSEGAGAWVFTIGFASVVYLGTRSVDLINRCLIIGLVLAYVALLKVISPHINVTLLHEGQPAVLWLAVPLIVTSFGFHLLIPSLKTYLNGNTKHLRIAILMGSILPFIVYAFWEFAILGVVPAGGEGGLTAMLKSGEPIVPLTNALDTLLGNSWVSVSARFFSFFAVVSSFIGVALGLFDFLADGFQIKKSPIGRFFLAGMTFLPPLIYALTFPQGFVTALGYAGIFAAILLVLYPAMMVFSGRYIKNIATGYRVIGGKLPLILAACFALAVIVIEILEEIGVASL